MQSRSRWARPFSRARRGTRRRRAPARRSLASVPVLLLTLASTACGGGGAPTAPTPPTDLAREQRFVTDPLVRLLPGLLSDPDAASGIEAALARVRRSVADGRPDRVRPALRALDAAVAEYATGPGFREADRVVLQALDLVRIRIELLLDAALGASGAPSLD